MFELSKAISRDDVVAAKQLFEAGERLEHMTSIKSASMAILVFTYMPDYAVDPPNDHLMMYACQTENIPLLEYYVSLGWEKPDDLCLYTEWRVGRVKTVAFWLENGFNISVTRWPIKRRSRICPIAVQKIFNIRGTYAILTDRDGYTNVRQFAMKHNNLEMWKYLVPNIETRVDFWQVAYNHLSPKMNQVYLDVCLPSIMDNLENNLVQALGANNSWWIEKLIGLGANPNRLAAAKSMRSRHLLLKHGASVVPYKFKHIGQVYNFRVWQATVNRILDVLPYELQDLCFDYLGYAGPRKRQKLKIQAIDIYRKEQLSTKNTNLAERYENPTNISVVRAHSYNITVFRDGAGFPVYLFDRID